MYVCMYVYVFPRVAEFEGRLAGFLALPGMLPHCHVASLAAVSVGLVHVGCQPSEVVNFYANGVLTKGVIVCCLAGVHGQCRQPLIEIFLFLFIQSGLEVRPLRCWLGSGCFWCPLALAACSVFLLEEVTEWRRASGACTSAWLTQGLGGYEATLSIQVPLDPTLRALDFLPNLP